MYLSEKVIRDSLRCLAPVHPFFGITFLACKQEQMPIGESIRFPIATFEVDVLRKYYQPNPRSRYYFHPFKTSGLLKWHGPKYPSSGLQAIRTRGDLAKAFIHEKDTDLWGWRSNYVETLQQKLERDKINAIPVFALATWLFRTRSWPDRASQSTVTDAFYRDFSITSVERDVLFADSLPKFDEHEVFSEDPLTDEHLLKDLPRAPDAVPDEGGTLRSVVLRGVGPADNLTFRPGERLTVITGDNGLGKTFLLESAWWSLTGNWAERPLHPRLDSKKREPLLSFEIAGAENRIDQLTVPYNWDLQTWPTPERRPLIPGLVVYARVDGSFAVWDPARHARPPHSATPTFSRDQVLYGLEGEIEGILRDWVSWQHNPDKRLFEIFSRVLEGLSPPEFALKAAAPVRLFNEPREVPTLRHSYGIVPFTSESAAIKRITTLAYLLVWAWNEHQVATRLARKPAQRKLVLLIDEVEAHLHPKWQRRVLPAILDVIQLLSREVEPQIIVATHSPLVLSSLETKFAEDTDKLFHLQLNSDGRVSLDEVRWTKYGSFDNWLTSDLFELRQARSLEAESLIEAARALMDATTPKSGSVKQLSEKLEVALAPDDDFWPRWLHFAEMKGVKL
jgi:hypothetical protein